MGRRCMEKKRIFFPTWQVSKSPLSLSESSSHFFPLLPPIFSPGWYWSIKKRLGRPRKAEMELDTFFLFILPSLSNKKLSQEWLLSVVFIHGHHTRSIPWSGVEVFRGELEKKPNKKIKLYCLFLPTIFLCVEEERCYPTNNTLLINSRQLSL